MQRIKSSLHSVNTILQSIIQKASSSTDPISNSFSLINSHKIHQIYLRLFYANSNLLIRIFNANLFVNYNRAINHQNWTSPHWLFFKSPMSIITTFHENSIKFRCFPTLMVRLNDTVLHSNCFWNDSIGIIPAVRYISPVFDRLYIDSILFSFQRSWNFKFKSYWKPEILSIVFDECVPLFYRIFMTLC